MKIRMLISQRRNDVKNVDFITEHSVFSSLSLALSVAGLALLLGGLSVKALANPSIVDQILQQSPDLDYGEYLASECAGCHNPEGDTSSSVPVIHGLNAEKLVQALVDYREGERENSSMQDVASNLGNEEIAALAAYLSNYSE
ncbi:MAG: hypothetical protein KTR32_20660 [Granulosicoccus sp.]|nr:hypothetical protein [Granulosicoccus sp.]